MSNYLIRAGKTGRTLKVLKNIEMRFPTEFSVNSLCLARVGATILVFWYGAKEKCQLINENKIKGFIQVFIDF